MINLGVDDMDGMQARLRAGGVEPVAGPESQGNSIFAWVMGPEGNRVEHRQPIPGDAANND